MNPSKGPRRELKVRLPVHVVEQLERERDARHLAGTLRAADGIPALLEEAVALRQDRDAEMERIRRLAVDLEERLAAAIRLAKASQRDARRARADRRARGSAKAQASLPAPQGPPQAALAAFQADHAAGRHAEGDLGVLAGLCPACGPAGASTGSQGAPPGPPAP